jgi:4-aminobutyrate aminotransferase
MDRATWTARNLEGAARALVDRDARVYIRQSGSTPCLTAIRRAQGVWLEDACGRRTMDFHGNSAHHLGYGHPRLVEALKRQLDELSFTPRRFTDEPAVALAEKLASLWPGGPGKVLLAPGGSDAVEIALKLARVATGRHKTVSFYDSYHGSGFGAVSLGGRHADRSPRIGPLLPGALHVPPFYRPAPRPGGEPADAEIWAERCVDAIRFTFEREGDIAALVAEPVRSTPHLPPRWFWPEVRRLCDAHRALLIYDEIPTGLGKTGRFFVSEHFEVTPDITVLGKALGGAVVPIAAAIARADLDVAPDLPLGHYTHEKNPLTATAALTTIRIIEDEALAERARRQGERALARLREMAERHPLIGDVRGLGLLLGVELMRDRREPAHDAASSIMFRALDRGLNFNVTEGNVIQLSPPLVVSKAEMDQALGILDDCLAAEETALGLAIG